MKFLHTDTDGLLAKNEAAIQAKHKFANDAAKVKDALLPVLFSVDSKGFIANYAMRNAIAIRNYPDMETGERGVMLVRGLLKDVHESYEAASELRDIKLTDRDILGFFAKRQDIVRKMPADLQAGLKTLIAEQNISAAPNALQQARPKGPLVLQEWQKRALEAELPPMPTETEIRRSKEAMDRAMQEAEEGERPKTLGELSRAQQRSAVPHSMREAGERAEGISGKMRAAAGQSVPSPWVAAYCNVKVAITGGSFPKCVL